ncbi:amidohydrolase family protein [Bosea thiooxidans]|nr:amidohydrolase family protein [Bosea sp. (in: a-proteobacteria)]
MLLRGGKIAAVGAGASCADAAVFDAGGRLMIPGLVEAHTHLDKSFWGMRWQRRPAGPCPIDETETERRNRREPDLNTNRQSGRLAVQMIKMGTTHIRSHVDVDTETGLASIEAVMAMREQLKDVIDVEIVAFARSGLLIRPGTLELLDRAMALGADVVGGLDPCAVDRDPKGHLDAIFGLAQKYGRPIDLHLHERGEMGAFSIDLTIERVRALGMQGMVAISHAFCLGTSDSNQTCRLFDDLARDRIALVITAPEASAAPSVLGCIKAGVLIAGGSDGVRDSWNPYGTGDMLERAMLIGLSNNFRRDAEVELALDICTYGGARVMSVANYGLAVGCDADLVILPGETLAEAVVSRPTDRTVLKGGRIVVRNGELTFPID